jgi:hypothetical protein
MGATKEGKVYVSDLDGTLLRDDASLSTFSQGILGELLNKGLPFTVASARSVVSIRKILAGLKFNLPIIEFNGAFITDLASGQHHIIHNLEPVMVENIYRLIKDDFGCVPFISTFNGTEDCLYYTDIVNDGMQWYLSNLLKHRDERLRAIENPVYAFRDKVVCLTVIGLAGLLANLKCAIEERYSNFAEMHLIENQYSPGWHWLTIHAPKATKAQAIQVVLETWGLNKAELIVFGDHSNDLTMFQLADRAIAVANATTTLKAHATQVIGSNNEDSVVRFIRDDWGEGMTRRAAKPL